MSHIIRVTATVCVKVIGLELSDDKVGVSDELMLVKIGITAGLLQLKFLKDAVRCSLKHSCYIPV